MTLEEAKKMLEKEGFKLSGPGKPEVASEDFTEYESPEICEAMQTVCSAGFQLAMLAGVFEVRKARLKKEYEKNTKAPAPGEEQSKENGLKAATDAFILQANEIMRLKKKNAELLEAIDKIKEGNPALEESASQFNEALLGEQAKKIAELTNENEDLKSWHEMQNRGIALSNIAFRDEKKRLGKEIAKLNGIIHKKNMKIEELRKESFRHLSGKVKMFGENVDLEQMLKDKNAVLADVAEELRLTKIREKNLTEVSQKYMKENEGLKEQLADKVVDEINANALKSAESALAWKEKVVTYKDMALAYYEKKIAEKDEVIADLTHELKAKHKKYVWYKGAYDAAQQILNTIADYAAKHPDKKFSDQMVEGNHPTEDNPEEVDMDEVLEHVRKALEEGHTVSIDYKD